jgi:hypothetical protein
MVYIAAPDDNLLAPNLTLIDQLGKIGSSDRVHVVVQIDTSILGAKRFFVNIGGQSPTLVQDLTLPTVQNTGSIEAFIDFVNFVKANHSAKHYLVVLNGHGHGVQDFPGDESKPFFEVTTEIVASVNAAADLTIGAATTSSSVVAEILPDNNPPDALTSRELKDAFDQASQILGKQIDIVGFDACLMSMIEIAMQIKESATLMVGSEQAIPTKGWPYPQIVNKLISNPDLEPTKLAEVIVSEFVAFYEARDQNEQLKQSVTDILVNNPGIGPSQLAAMIVAELAEVPAQKEQVMLATCDLAKAEGLSATIGALVPQLSQCLKIPELNLAVLRARFNSLSFLDSDFLDLFNFCGHLSDALDDEPFLTACSDNGGFCQQLKTTCEAIKNQISEDGTGFVIHRGITFPQTSALKDARGISIYLPLILPLYHELEFSKRANWHVFLKEYMTTFFQADEVSKTAAATFSNSQQVTDRKTKGGFTAMSSHPTTAPARTLCLILDAGATITDKATGKSTKITGMSFLDMIPESLVQVPDGTVVTEPNKPGVKASSGTELKASSGTELKGTPGASSGPILQMAVPACTLREATTTKPNTELSDGTLIVATSTAPIVVVSEIRVTAPLP